MAAAVQSFLAKVPHWLYLLVATFGGGVASYLATVPSATLVGAVTTTVGLVTLAKAAAIAGVVAVASWLKPAPNLTAAAVFCLCLAFGATGCGWLQSHPAVLNDLEADGQCVATQIEGGNLDPVAIETACLPGQLSTVVGLIEALLGSSSFKAKHTPATLATLSANCKAVWAKLAAPDAGAY